MEADERIASGAEITRTSLAELGYLRKPSSLVKILGSGTLKKKLMCSDIDAVSATALSKIEKAGGSIELAQPVAVVSASQ